jgi:hypothetical protein
MMMATCLGTCDLIAPALPLSVSGTPLATRPLCCMLAT